jgi:hypothetical protein
MSPVICPIVADLACTSVIPNWAHDAGLEQDSLILCYRRKARVIATSELFNCSSDRNQQISSVHLLRHSMFQSHKRSQSNAADIMQNWAQFHGAVQASNVA